MVIVSISIFSKFEKHIKTFPAITQHNKNTKLDIHRNIAYYYADNTLFKEYLKGEKRIEELYKTTPKVEISNLLNINILFYDDNNGDIALLTDFESTQSNQNIKIVFFSNKQPVKEIILSDKDYKEIIPNIGTHIKYLKSGKLYIIYTLPSTSQRKFVVFDFEKLNYSITTIPNYIDPSLSIKYINSESNIIASTKDSIFSFDKDWNKLFRSKLYKENTYLIENDILSIRKDTFRFETFDLMTFGLLKKKELNIRNKFQFQNIYYLPKSDKFLLNSTGFNNSSLSNDSLDLIPNVYYDPETPSVVLTSLLEINDNSKNLEIATNIVDNSFYNDYFLPVDNYIQDEIFTQISRNKKKKFNFQGKLIEETFVPRKLEASFANYFSLDKMFYYDSIKKILYFHNANTIYKYYKNETMVKDIVTLPFIINNVKYINDNSYGVNFISDPSFDKVGYNIFKELEIWRFEPVKVAKNSNPASGIVTNSNSEYLNSLDIYVPSVDKQTKLNYIELLSRNNENFNYLQYIIENPDEYRFNNITNLAPKLKNLLYLSKDLVVGTTNDTVAQFHIYDIVNKKLSSFILSYLYFKYFEPIQAILDFQVDPITKTYKMAFVVSKSVTSRDIKVIINGYGSNSSSQSKTIKLKNLATAKFTHDNKIFISETTSNGTNYLLYDINTDNIDTIKYTKIPYFKEGINYVCGYENKYLFTIIGGFPNNSDVYEYNNLSKTFSTPNWKNVVNGVFGEIVYDNISKKLLVMNIEETMPTKGLLIDPVSNKYKVIETSNLIEDADYLKNFVRPIKLPIDPQNLNSMTSINYVFDNYSKTVNPNSFPSFSKFSGSGKYLGYSDNHFIYYDNGKIFEAKDIKYSSFINISNVIKKHTKNDLVLDNINSKTNIAAVSLIPNNSTILTSGVCFPSDYFNDSIKHYSVSKFQDFYDGDKFKDVHLNVVYSTKMPITFASNKNGYYYANFNPVQWGIPNKSIYYVDLDKEQFIDIYPNSSNLSIIDDKTFYYYYPYILNKQEDLLYSIGRKRVLSQYRFNDLKVMHSVKFNDTLLKEFTNSNQSNFKISQKGLLFHNFSYIRNNIVHVISDKYNQFNVLDSFLIQLEYNAANYFSYDKLSFSTNSNYLYYKTATSIRVYDITYYNDILSVENDYSNNTSDMNSLLYPNPCYDLINFDLSLSLLPYYIYDINGNEIQKGYTNLSVDVKNLKSGCYVVKILKDSETVVKSFIKLSN